MRVSAFLRDERGVAPIIGTMLILLIGSIFFASFTSVMIPAWNLKQENEHLDEIYDDMVAFKAAIEDVALYEEAKAANLHLGFKYGGMLQFINPGLGVSGQLRYEPVNITYNYTREGTTYSATVPSYRLVYEVAGRTEAPKMVYEHGAIILNYLNINISTVDQPLILGDNIYVPIINTTKSSTSAMGVKTIEILPHLTTTTTSDVSNFVIVLDTNYPDAWNSLLSGTNSSLTTVTFPTGKIRINSSKVNEIVIPSTSNPTGAMYAGIGKFREFRDAVWNTGGGKGTMGPGSMWNDIPNSTVVNTFKVKNIIVGAPVGNLDNDIAWIVVTDSDADWWKVTFEFNYREATSQQEIIDLEAKSAGGTSNYKYGGAQITSGNPMPFNTSTIIDLLNTSMWTSTSGIYQSAGIGNDNTLSVVIGDKTNLKDTALISFHLVIQ